jgi:hypothetical protein
VRLCRSTSAACYATGLDPACTTPIAKGKAAATLADWLNAEYRLLDPYSVRIPITSPTEPPLPELILHHGYQCAQCDLVVTKTVENKLRHRSVPRKRDGQSKVANIHGSPAISPRSGYMSCRETLISAGPTRKPCIICRRKERRGRPGRRKLRRDNLRPRQSMFAAMHLSTRPYTARRPL